ncbi:hypothetical protein J1N35_029246, partial [Gossypium stocksii]
MKTILSSVSQHIKLILEEYELTSFVDGSLSYPPRFVPTQDSQMVFNLEAS